MTEVAEHPRKSKVTTGPAFIVTRAEILPLAKRATYCIGNARHRPVLACVRITSDADSVSLFTTNLQASLYQTTSTVQVERAGETAVDAQRFMEVIGACRGDSIKIEMDDSRLFVRTQSGTISLPTLDPTHLPPRQNVPAVVGFETDAQVLSESMRRVSFAIGKISSLNQDCLYLGASGSGFRAIGFNGRLVAECAHECSATELSAVLPSGAYGPLTRMLDEGAVRVCVSENSLYVQGEDYEFSTLMAEGDYPARKWESEYAKNANRTAWVAKEDLIAAVEQSLSVAAEKSPASILAFSPKVGIQLKTKSERGESDVSVPCKAEASVTLGINLNYLSGVLSGMEGEEITIKYGDAKSTCIALSSDKCFRCLVAPVSMENQ